MKKYLGLILILVAMTILHAETIITSSNVDGTWTIAGSPYLISNDITVPSSETLSIEAGVHVVFTGSYMITALGTINAIGTESDSIKFYPQDTSQGWQGIRFTSSVAHSDTSRFIHCSIRYAINSLNGGGMYFSSSSSKARISHCTIADCRAYSGAGICGSGFLVIEDSIIKNNSTYSMGPGGGLQIGNNVVVANNYIIHNSSEQGGGGGIRTDGSEAVIKNNVIAYNSSINIGGGISANYSSAMIVNNVIANNRSGDGGGIYANWYSFLRIIGNLIANNTASTGGGIGTDQRGISKIVNNTIVNNWAGDGGGMRLRYFYPQDVTIANNILWGNQASVGSQVSLSEDYTPYFDYCCIQYGSGGFYGGSNLRNCISSNPQFVAQSAGAGINYDGVAANWGIMDVSPCANTGDPYIVNYNLPEFDLAGHPRIYDGRIDIGAYERELPPLLRLNSSSGIDFGAVYLNTNTSPQALSLTSIGNLPLNIESVQLGLYPDAFLVSCQSIGEDIIQNQDVEIQVSFAPSSHISYSDTLYVFSNAINTPVLKIPLCGIGIVAPPCNPEDVEIQMNGMDAVISWSAVTEDVIGAPVSPDCYLVFFNGSSDLEPDSEYYFLGLSSSLSYTHYHVGQFSPYMFYRVRAYIARENRAQDPDNLGIEAGMSERSVLILLGLVDSED